MTEFLKLKRMVIILNMQMIFILLTEVQLIFGLKVQVQYKYVSVWLNANVENCHKII